MNDNLKDLKPGDKIIRRIEDWCIQDGIVKGITNKVIICSVWTPDGLRIMEFDQETGINIHGKDMGYIKPGETGFAHWPK